MLNFLNIRRTIISMLVFLPATFVPVESPANTETEPVCVYISSYHRGLEWSDRVEAGLRDGLQGHCRIVQYDMDTKRNQSEVFEIKAASEALDIIRQEAANIVITSDDNAARYLIKPYLAEKQIPVVFTGFNWTVAGYGFPVKNVTGMVEVSPLVPLTKQTGDSIPNAKRAAYIGASSLTEDKNFERFKIAAIDEGIELVSMRSATFEEWKGNFSTAQNYDFVIVGNIDGIEGWNAFDAKEHVANYSNTFSLSSHDWMMPYSALGYTPLPEEQGEWAAASAIAILDGMLPDDIPIVTNRKWDAWVNTALLKASGVKMPAQVVDSAKLY